MSKTIRSRTPLRISFSGGGTDVPPYPQQKGGAVLSVTINKYVYSSLVENGTPGITVQSLDYDVVAKYHTEEDLQYNGNLDLVKAVIRKFKMNIDGVHLFMHSDAPPGSGLGSSSALVVALTGLISQRLRLPLTNYQIAEIAYEIERIDLCIKGGMQDQYAAAFGGVNFIEFYDRAVFVNPLRIERDILNELEYNLLLCYTGKTRLSANIVGRQTEAFIRKDEKVVAALDKQKEFAIEMKNKLLTGCLDDFGDLLNEAWEAKKNLDPMITSPVIDELYAVARKEGARGGKILGAGGGGYLLLYCPFYKKHNIARALEQMGGQIVEFGFDLKGLQTWEF